MTNSGNEPPSGQEPDPQPADPERLPPHGDPVAPPGWGQQQPPQPPYGQPVYGQPQYGQPYYAAPGYDSAAPYGRHPMTGLPYSDKSKVTAGLLQLLLPFVGICGVGRLYSGHLAIGLIQLLGMFVGFVLFLVFIGILIVPAIWLWTVIDGIILLSGTPVDAQGKPLRA